MRYTAFHDSTLGRWLYADIAFEEADTAGLPHFIFRPPMSMTFPVLSEQWNGLFYPPAVLLV